MHKSIFLFISFVGGIISTVSGQDKNNDPVTARFSYSAYAGMGRSLFKSNIDGPTKFPSPEVRLGVSAGWLFQEHFEIATRLIFGLKVKREKDDQPYPYTGPYISQNDMAGRNHYFLEIPVLVQYRFLHPKISFGAGVSYRQFFNINSSKPVFDPLSGKKEVGLIGRVSYRLNDRINIGIEQYFALTNLYTSSGTINGEQVDLSVKNRYTQIIFEYRLSKKK